MAREKPNETDPTTAPQGEQPETAAGAAEEVLAEEAAWADGREDAQSDAAEPLCKELEEAKDRALRVQAELENYRKRVARQMAEERRYANLPLMRDLLPVLDNINRAIEAAESAHDTAGLLEGFKMVARQLEDVLGRHNCVRIEALHEAFDPNLHEAISQQPSDEYPPGTVVIQTQTGFQLHDRVVRPSQVIVSSVARSEI